MNRIGLLTLTMIFLLQSQTAESFERRRNQFGINSSYLLLPLPYSYPGIGEGVMAIGLAGDVAGTHTDLTALQAFGDVEGSVISISDFHILNELLYLDVLGQKFNKLAIQNYESRGMGSSKDEFNFIEANAAQGYGGELTLALFEKRLELAAGVEKFSFTVAKIRDNEGDVIAEIDNPAPSESQYQFTEVYIDYTDDYADPRKGVRLRVRNSESSGEDQDGPEFTVLNSTLNGYIPVGSSSTFVLTHFSSDALVSSEGLADPAALADELGISCQGGDIQCEHARDEIIDQTINENRFGTADSLGGKDKLRSYPQNRFTAAHSRMVGSEFRWNISEKVRPFDFGIWKDVAASYQLAFFYEVGTVAETKKNLWKESRQSYGGGFRMISQSGFVYRADFAQGEEGSSFTVFFEYPW